VEVVQHHNIIIRTPQKVVKPDHNPNTNVLINNLRLL